MKIEDKAMHQTELIHFPVLEIKSKQQKESPTLEEMDITKENLETICKRATPSEGVIPNYISALENDVSGNPTDTAICVADIHGNIKTVGAAQNTIVSAQSTIKVFLYIFALHKGADARDIALGEAVAKKFNEDPITTGDASSVETAYHPLNNAGGISSASEITEREEFMNFIKQLAGNQNLSVLSNVYESEKNGRQSNLRIAASLATKGRFDSNKMLPALDAYTKACSIGLTVTDLTNMGLVMAKGGIGHDGKRLFAQDIAVRAMSAMNSFGFYEATGRMTLLQSGSRPLTAKSGVGGLVMHVNPGIGAFTTLGRYLDEAGNSVFGMKAAILLNNMLCTPGAMRLSGEETSKMLGDYINDVQQFTVREALARREKGAFQQSSFLLEKHYIDNYQESLEKQIATSDDLNGLINHL